MCQPESKKISAKSNICSLMGFDGKTHTLDHLWNENISLLLAQNGFKMFKSHFKCYAEKGGYLDRANEAMFYLRNGWRH